MVSPSPSLPESSLSPASDFSRGLGLEVEQRLLSLYHQGEAAAVPQEAHAAGARLNRGTPARCLLGSHLLGPAGQAVLSPTCLDTPARKALDDQPCAAGPAEDKPTSPAKVQPGQLASATVRRADSRQLQQRPGSSAGTMVSSIGQHGSEDCPTKAGSTAARLGRPAASALTAQPGAVREFTAVSGPVRPPQPRVRLAFGRRLRPRAQIGEPFMMYSLASVVAAAAHQLPQCAELWPGGMQEHLSCSCHCSVAIHNAQMASSHDQLPRWQGNALHPRLLRTAGRHLFQLSMYGACRSKRSHAQQQASCPAAGGPAELQPCT